MAITAAQVKELRDITGISMMECKKALVETDGDVQKAIDELRKRGLAKAAKRADNATTEGLIKSLVEGNKAYIVSVWCETDFVAITPEFSEMVDTFISVLKEAGNEETAKEKMEELKAEFILKMGENIVIKDACIIEGDNIGVYIHSNKKVAGVVAGSKDEETLKQVAMHISASKPTYLSPSDVEEEIVAKEKEIAMEQMKNDPKMEGKPEQVLEKILEGKLNKFKDENSLLTQDFVMDPSKKVKDVTGEDGISTFKLFTI